MNVLDILHYLFGSFWHFLELLLLVCAIRGETLITIKK